MKRPYWRFMIKRISANKSLHMKRAIIDRQSRFLHRLGQCRMRMTGARNILSTGGKLHRQRRLGNHITGLRAQYMHAQNLIALGIGENFYKAICRAITITMF